MTFAGNTNILLLIGRFEEDPMCKRQFLVPVFFLLCGLTYQAQSRAEYQWAFFHPFSALRVKHITGRCDVLYQAYKKRAEPDAFENGGRLDAFRHCFYMAAYAQKIKRRKLIRLGHAHEKGNYKSFLRSQTEEGELADFMSCEMDLFNNYLGISLGSENRNLDLDSLAVLVITAIYQGRAAIMKRNVNGQYLKCGGEVLDLDRFKKDWMRPKCLVPSNYLEKD
jgi:hypothetical protein